MGKRISYESSLGNKIRVLHLIYSLDIGGAEKDLVTKAKILVNKGYDIGICCLVRRGDLAKIAVGEKINIYCLYMSCKLDIIALFRFLKLIKKIKPHILHLHLFESWFFGVIANLVFFLRLPVVATVQATLERFSKLEIITTKYLARFTDKIIASSFAVKTSLIKYCGISSGKIRVIYNGIDFNEYGVNKQSKQSNKKPLFITISRLIKEKGIDCLLKAAKILKDEYKLDFKLVIIGYGRLYEELTKLKDELSLQEEVEFLGKVVDIKSFLHSADLFILPSLSEALGLVLVEAAAMRIPIVASRVGGIMEVINDGEMGLLASPGDARDLADKIYILLKDKERQKRFVERCYQHVRDNFSVENLVKELEEVYRSLMML